MTFAEISTKKDINDSYNPEIGKNKMQSNCDNGDDDDCYTKNYMHTVDFISKKD